MIRFLLLFVVLFCLPYGTVFAGYDPRERPNNKYGIHIIDPNDLDDAADLVNSTGGEWGYVTVVIAESDKNQAKWQEAFNRMRRLRLIPIIRLATTSIDDYWSIPTTTSSDDWVRFLGSLNWPTQNRYVAVFNEPNHAKEWGNTISPEIYAEAFTYLATLLKAASEDYFILPAAMDVSAENYGGSLDAGEFIRRMIAHKPEITDLIDGLNSHSYPNPGFSGKPTDRGRGTLASYVWERGLWQSLGLKRDLPVFITETGWQHSEGKVFDPKLLSPAKLSDYYVQAMTSVWNDSDIVAVTPFVLSYQDYPFDHFSWKTLDSGEMYEHYDSYRRFPKIAGKPQQRRSYLLENGLVPFTLVADSEYSFAARLINNGQDIIIPDRGYGIRFVSGEAFGSATRITTDIEPGAQGTVEVDLHTPEAAGTYPVRLSVIVPDNDDAIIEEKEIEIVPPPSIELSYRLAWKKEGDVDSAKVLVYDTDNLLIHEYPGQTGALGAMYVENLRDVVPGGKYRVVLVVPGYLPRQTEAYIISRGTRIVFDRLLPVDADRDGAFTVRDLTEILKISPGEFLLRFVI